MLGTTEMVLWIVGLVFLILTTGGACVAGQQKQTREGENQYNAVIVFFFFVFGVVLLSGTSYDLGKGNAAGITDGLYEVKSNVVYNGDIALIVMKSVPMTTTQENTTVITTGEIYTTPFYYKIDKSKVDPTIKNGDMVIALDGFLRRFNTKN